MYQSLVKPFPGMYGNAGRRARDEKSDSQNGRSGGGSVACNRFAGIEQRPARPPVHPTCGDPGGPAARLPARKRRRPQDDRPDPAERGRGRLYGTYAHADPGRDQQPRLPYRTGLPLRHRHSERPGHLRRNFAGHRQRSGGVGGTENPAAREGKPDRQPPEPDLLRALGRNSGDGSRRRISGRPRTPAHRLSVRRGRRARPEALLAPVRRLHRRHAAARLVRPAPVHAFLRLA